jgi:acetyl-CoA carboxylase carboxyl transferase subunit beta
MMSENGRRWFEQRKDLKVRTRDDADPDGLDLWTLCPSCNEALHNELLDENARVCHLCGYHFRLEVTERIDALCDPGSPVLHDSHLQSVDALGFEDSRPYRDRIAGSRAATGRNEAFVSLSATMDGIAVELGVFDFRFLGGSMGSVVGEQVTRLFERAAERRHPVIVISASGGARMQEGVLSLMQMGKSCAALARLKDEAKVPYLSVLTHPTTGGVAASFAMLGDLVFAEPGALIGFAGPRVIQQTIGEDLPDGFQTAEYLLEHGMIDRIVPRRELRRSLVRVLRQLMRLEASAMVGNGATVPGADESDEPSARSRSAS